MNTNDLYNQTDNCNGALHEASKPMQDWSAGWIWQSADGPENTWICFRKTFTLERIPLFASANIGADSKYWLWINGNMAVFEGGIARGPRPGDTFYDQIKITPYLKAGINTVAILVWHWGRPGRYHSDSGKGGLLFQADIGGYTLVSDQTWKMKVHPSFNPNSGGGISGGFRGGNSYSVDFDGRAGLEDWTSSAWHTEGYNDDGWSSAVEKGRPPVSPWNSLEKNPVPALKDHGLLDYISLEIDGRPIALPYSSEGSVVIDARLDCNKAVTPFLEVEAVEGRIIEISMDNVNCAITARYTTRTGIQGFEGYSWMSGHAVRYSVPGGVTVKSLKYRWTSVGEATGSFECSDGFYSRLWWMAKNTLMLCARDIFMCCPDRERGPWIGDNANECGELFYTMDNAGRALMSKQIRMACTHRKGKAICIPFEEQSWVPELPFQSLHFMGWHGVWWYYFNTGDLDTLAFAYPYTKDYLSLWTMNANGLPDYRTGTMDWSDWAGDGLTEGIDSYIMQACMYYMALKAAVNMAEVLGEKRDTVWYRSRMDSIEKHFDNVFWNGEYYTSEGRCPHIPLDRSSIWNGDYYTGEKGLKDDRANALAVISGLAPASKYDDIVNNVLSPVRNASPYMECYTEEACCLAGRYDLALDRMRSAYASQVNDGNLTTLSEYRSNPYSGTYNHAWNAPNTVLSRYFAGIGPEAAGWSVYHVLPKMDGMTYISQLVPSVKGNIRMTARNEKDCFCIDLVSPSGTRAIVGIPCDESRPREISVNGTTVWNGSWVGGVNGISWNREDKNYIIFDTAPGIWNFASVKKLANI